MSPNALAWKPHFDRRSRRSTNASVAASLYLERVLERCTLDAISLAPVDSQTIAASATSDSSRADVASLARAGVDMIRGNEDAGLEGVDVFAHAVVIGGRTCVLASAGKRVDRLKTIAADLARILA